MYLSDLAKIPSRRCFDMAKRNVQDSFSDEQRVRKNLSKEFDHELANEPYTPNEKYNNKKTKKRQ